MSTHLPFLTLRPLYRQCAWQRPYVRAFSSTAPRSGKLLGRVDPEQAVEAADAMAGKAPNTITAELEMDEGNFPDDIGLLPGTFVRLPWRELPTILSPDRWRYEWKFAKSLVSMWASLWQYKQAKTTRPKPKVEFFVWSRGYLKEKAMTNYKHLYQAFAKGDGEAISKICLSGVAKQFRHRITKREDGLRVDWSVKFKRARVVSNRASKLPLHGSEDMALRQVIVRLETEQTLNLHGESILKGAVAQNTGKKALAWAPDGFQPQPNDPRLYQRTDFSTTKEVTEHIVMQRRMLWDKEEDWMIWGFVDGWTLERATEEEEYMKELQAYQGERTA